jgi:hypothetical protein
MRQGSEAGGQYGDESWENRLHKGHVHNSQVEHCKANEQVNKERYQVRDTAIEQRRRWELILQDEER